MSTHHADDPTIPHDERLFRRIHLTHLVEGDEGTSEVSSAAFRATELSVNLESVMVRAGRPPQDALRNHRADLLMSLTAGVCREHGQLVGPDPIPDEPAHGYAYGKKSRNTRRTLRDAARWVVPEQTPPYAEIRERKQQLGISDKDVGALD